MSFAGYLRTMLRECRGAAGRLGFFVACLAVGVAAVVAVAGLSSSLDSGLRAEARQLLAADLVVEGSQPLPPGTDLLRSIDLPGVRRTDVKEMVTVVSAPGVAGWPGRPGASQLVELKAIDGEYPFYGKLELLPRSPLADLLRADTAVVAPELLSRLGLKVGDPLLIGGQTFRIAGKVLSEPDRISISLTLGPRVFLNGAGLGRTTLVARGSRVNNKTLIKLPDGASPPEVTAAAGRLRRSLPHPSFYRVETYREGQPALRTNFQRIGTFLGLVALLSLFVGGIGVAQSVRAWLASRMDAIAILKCLGMRPREILALYLGQTALLGLAGSLAGMAVGAAVQTLLPYLFPDLIPAELIRVWQPTALLRGLGLGLGVAILFSLPPLAGVLRVPAARVLRRDAEPLPGHRPIVAGTLAALAAGILVMAALQSGSWLRGAQFTGGVVGVTLALTLAALAVVWGVRRLPRGFGGFSNMAIRHGLAALARPGAATMGAIVALGLGVLVVLAMSLVERRLSQELTSELPVGAPSAFLVDIQPDQWPGVERLLRQAGASRVESVPVVMARLTAIDGRGVERMAGRMPRGGRRWALTREQRLTYMAKLPEDNVIVAGKLWSDPRKAEVSLEQEFANDLGVGLGSTLTFDVQGVPIDLTVTSLRTVNWQTFGINFFLVVEPGVLESAPQQRLAVAHLPRGGEQRVQDLLAARYPNVTLLKIREILEKIVHVLRRIGLGVRFLGGFTVLAGIAILAGAVSAGAGRRGLEVALLKTLGVTRRGVMATFAVEYALIGLVAGVIGAAGGAVLSWAVVTRGFTLRWEPQTLPLLAAVAGSILLTVIAGIGASFRALERRPIEVLRSP
ncbi:MAG TPA: FtsX-like permease family protein [Thermoanaerobaculia bacterium]|nr:FtsX-like permease family protein [Thermoanaerobaculia bacterium]